MMMTMMTTATVVMVIEYLFNKDGKEDTTLNTDIKDDLQPPLFSRSTETDQVRG